MLNSKSNYLTYLPNEESDLSIGQAIIDKYYSSNKDDLIIVCIGTDKAIFDSFGPFLGTYCEDLDLTIYGTLDDPIHALNLEKRLAEIKDKHPNDFIVAVDATISQINEFGTIGLKTKAIQPGAGAGKKLSSIGDVGLFLVTSNSYDDSCYRTCRISDIRKAVLNIKNDIAYIAKIIVAERKLKLA